MTVLVRELGQWQGLAMPVVPDELLVAPLFTYTSVLVWMTDYVVTHLLT